MLFVLTMVNDVFVDASDGCVMQLELLLKHRRVSDDLTKINAFELYEVVDVEQLFFKKKKEIFSLPVYT